MDMAKSLLPRSQGGQNLPAKDAARAQFADISACRWEIISQQSVG